ncbi:male sterility domain containing protein [Penicillium odoratum]|uniref:male sterility domain containing protein n=1 Tax=Penicillium odoratum TaxID=1167516 RepID=UPI002548E33B|nr:male sterility domain containing protein [Penicillium odoratum]KAJ5761303.1 male sterility domain containing protein [Penicillium odoratum]
MAMWEYFSGKSVLITGGSGFLGTAITYRLLDRSSVCHVYILCRGGVESKWKMWLSERTVEMLLDSTRLSVVDGDMLLLDMGISKTELEKLQLDVNAVVHTASSINLGRPLSGLQNSIIGASEMIARFSLTCKELDRFVYVSSAYANAHLHAQPEHPVSDVEIKEDFYDLKLQGDPMDEWNQVQENGTSESFETENFPWAYAYAKHLTERLLLQLFSQHADKTKLLIIRPSVIGPAQAFPFPGYSIPISTPSTMLAAGIALTLSPRVKIATRVVSPETQTHIDEVPVDVVVDRLLSHLAVGTYGCVHAVSGKKARMVFQEWWQGALMNRRIPWNSSISWVSADWKSQEQHHFNRLYVILGASFEFSEERTVSLSTKLTGEDLSGLQLFNNIDLAGQLLDRKGHIQYVMEKFAQKGWLVWLIVKLLYGFGYTN